MPHSNDITCPNCGHRFPADEAFVKQAEAKFRAQYEEESQRNAQMLAEQRRKLEKEKESIAQMKKSQEDIVKQRLEEEKKKLHADTEKQLREEFESEMKSLQEENDKRKAENKNLKEKELALLKQEAALKERQEELNLELEKQLLERQKEIEDKARARERESFELEKVKLLKQIEDNRKLAEEMKRKAEQGSMQMQGEVQELALEEFLSHEYPYDMIEEIRKGKLGADVIQTVRNDQAQECGKILYESKRTKDFSPKWIEKLKNDQINSNADIAVIVTETLPGDMLRFGHRENVWICTYQEVKGLSFVLRQMLIQVHAASASEENKADKMTMLYDYLTSSEFSRRIEAIVDGFSNMKTGLEKEKNAMNRIWNEREKQIEKVTLNTIGMYGSIKGIAGKAIGTVKALELPEPEV